MINYKEIGKVAAGFLLGTAGVSIMSSRDAKKAYTYVTAAALRGKDSVLKRTQIIRENAGDIYEDAKEMNEERAAEEAAREIEDAKEILRMAEEKSGQAESAGENADPEAAPEKDA